MKYMTRTLAALGLIAAGHAQATTSLVNGDFESGLAGWSTVGDASTYTATTGALLLSTASTDLGAYDDPQPWSGTSAVDNADGALTAFAGLSSGALDLIDGNGDSLPAYTGSAASQTFSVAAGSTLSFSWNLLSKDTYFADYAYVVINGSLTQLGNSLSNTASASLAGLSTASGWQTFSHTFSQASTVQLVLGVVNVGDTTATSALLVDNVQVAAVPEPASLALALGGLAVVAASARRRRAA